jgi:CheY-like chemotaxis protein
MLRVSIMNRGTIYTRGARHLAGNANIKPLRVMSASRIKHRAPHVNGVTKPPRPAMVNRILLIERERQIRRFITAGLQLHNYSVAGAESGKAGLSIVLAIRPDLIILAPALPDMNGAEVLKAIRSWSDVPIIILSIQSGEEHIVSFLRSGADDYITKPFGIVELAARCEVVLRRYHEALAGIHWDGLDHHY